ncbi:MAG: glycosyltransferase family 2 protein [Bacteroidia bacterium]|nr:glycosyltransferase family 2 protein [Bacteroidia bacterium]
MIKTAVVILKKKKKKLLKEFLPPLVANTTHPDFQLFVADNASTDDSIIFIQDNFPVVKIIALDINYGFAQGYNKALAQIDAKYFVLLNSDIEVTPLWLEPMVKIMDNDKNIAACMPKIKSYHQKNYFEYAGAGGGFIDKYGFPFCQGRIFNVIEEDKGQYNEECPIFWASGACMIIRADLYHQTGGLDKDFFAHMEEIDLCWRLKNMGYKIMYIPMSEVYHIGGYTLQMGSPRKAYLNFRNNLFLLLKNLPSNKLLSIMFIRFILDGIAGLKFLLGGEFKLFIAVVKAHFSFYLSIKKFLVKRKFNKANLFKIYNHPEILQSSIVFNFFIKKLQSFQQLKF